MLLTQTRLHRDKTGSHNGNLKHQQIFTQELVDCHSKIRESKIICHQKFCNADRVKEHLVQGMYPEEYLPY